MALDPEERKIAALFAAFEEINTRVDGAVQRLEEALGNLDPAVRKTIREVMAQELQGLESQVNQTSASLQTMRQAADWRHVLLGGALVALVVAITLGGFWVLVPSREELKQLRAERATLQGNIDELAARGGRADFKTCGPRAHLCVRVDPSAGNFGKEDVRYQVVYGY